jgi:type II secretory pathway pseudopilin PulG
MEVLVSIFVITALSGALLLGSRTDQDGLKRLSNSRAAMRVAEATMTALQSGQTPPTHGDHAVTVRVLSQPAELPQMAWVEVATVVDRDHATLIGLVPRAAVGAAPPAGVAP